MPYIPPERRPQAKTIPLNTGELTYAIQQLLKGYILRASHQNFQTYAECVAALECARFDLEQRRLKRYEQAKRSENGDVW